MSEHWSPIASDTERAFVARALATSFATPAEAAGPFIDEAGPERLRVFRDERGPIASAMVVWCGQFFGGRSVPMAGVRAVAVPPEHRGGGTATRMMQALLHEAHHRGTPLSTLYAATQSLYRRVGYEQAGHRNRVTLDPARIKARAVPGLRVRPMDPAADRDAVASCHHAMARHMPGHLDRDDYLWTNIRSPRGMQTDTLLIEDDSGVVGFYTARLERQPSPARGFALWVGDWAFTHEAAGRAVLAALAGYGSVATEIRLHGGPSSPLLMLLDEQKYRIDHEEHWMTRIVRLADAVSARGYAPGVNIRLGLRVHDPLFAANDGDWTLTVADGQGQCERGGTPEVELDIGAMAAVYTGYASPAQLALTGRVREEPDALARLGAAFAGPTPSMVDFF